MTELVTAMHCLAVVLVVVVGFAPLDRVSDAQRWALFAFFLATLAAGSTQFTLTAG